jgi:hypothetical protein
VMGVENFERFKAAELRLAQAEAELDEIIRETPMPLRRDLALIVGRRIWPSNPRRELMVP